MKHYGVVIAASLGVLTRAALALPVA